MSDQGPPPPQYAGYQQPQGHYGRPRTSLEYTCLDEEQKGPLC